MNDIEWQGLVTRRELAERLGVTEETVRGMCRRGVIPVIRLGHRTVRFDPAAVGRAVRGLSSQKGGKSRGGSSQAEAGR